ncbi:hypothetical protein Tco_0979502 [Tanacetum coccineum]
MWWRTLIRSGSKDGPSVSRYEVMEFEESRKSWLGVRNGSDGVDLVWKVVVDIGGGVIFTCIWWKDLVQDEKVLETALGWG